MRGEGVGPHLLLLMDYLVRSRDTVCHFRIRVTDVMSSEPQLAPMGEEGCLFLLKVSSSKVIET